ncbi:DMT family transporter [Devosia oryziradicis]|uniref:DMT family transporter n=1 Tax=Devosia oryziradicis TaxID=2801335 RepID=A0ABX7C064_9HYPH|nr:DMT family transporter [Devosia oryziradicis]QQR37612.1 DMT family transporter [Devosia oryziradicis]
MSSPIAADARADNVGRAIVLTLITIGVFGVQDAISKILVQTYSPFQITMMRYWGFAVFSLLLVMRQAPLRQALNSKVPLWQVLRGVLLMADIWFFALALRTVPLGELQAITVVYPLLVTLFAIPILGEKVGIFRFVAVGAGFAGALVIVRPGGLPLDWGVGFALISATLYSIYIVITRKVGQHDSAATSMTYTALIGLVMSAMVGVFFWQPMGWGDFALVVTVMATTCAGHGLMVYALSMAPASVVQPFNYFSLPWAIALSAVVFGHWIDPISMIGAAIIVAAGLVVMARERVKRVAVVADPAMPGRE